MNKKILYIRTDICEIPINVGGSIGHTLGVIHGFVKLRYRVDVFSSQMQQVLARDNIIKVNFIPLRVWPIFYIVRWRFWYLRWRLDCIFSNIFFTLQIFWKIRKQHYDLIYQRYSVMNCTGILLSRLLSIPYILEYNGSEAYWFDVSKNDVWYRRWFAFRWLSYRIEAFNVKHASCVVVVSQALYDDLVLRGVDTTKIIVNPNGVDTEQFNQECLVNERNALRKQYKLDDCFVFGFIGTFGHWHGIEVLSFIIPELVKKDENVRFLLIGDGVLKPSIEQALSQEVVSGKVIFTGKIPQDKGPEYLAACDAFLCPTQPNADGTRFFGSPTKLFEYMSMAKPIIASDLEQLSEIMSPAIKISSTMQHVNGTINDEVGFLVDPLDFQGFIQACQVCIAMPYEDRKKMGNNARQKVLMHYTWEKHVEKIVTYFEKGKEI